MDCSLGKIQHINFSVDGGVLLERKITIEASLFGLRLYLEMGTCCSKLFWDAASSRIPHGSLVKQLSSDLAALDKTAEEDWSHPNETTRLFLQNLGGSEDPGSRK